MTDFGGFGSDAEQGNDFGTGDGTGDKGGGWGGFGGISTGNKVMDVIIGSVFPGLGIIDRLAGINWGDGVAGRGSSNNPTEQGASSNDVINEIIATLTGQREQERQPITANPRARQEGSRQFGSSRGSNMRYPNIGGGLRRRPSMREQPPPMMLDRKPGWDNPPADLERMPRIIDDKMLRMPIAPTGSITSMMGTEQPDLSKMFAGILKDTESAVQDRSGGLQYALGRYLNRGDITDDAGSINMAVGPLMKQARSTALSSMLGGSRVPDQLFDLNNLGANIGANQGAQNVNVRGRLRPQTRRY